MGADCITQAGALLDFALSVSYEQLYIEDEIVKWVQRIFQGSRIDRSTLTENELFNLPLDTTLNQMFEHYHSFPLRLISPAGRLLSLSG